MNHAQVQTHWCSTNLIHSASVGDVSSITGDEDRLLEHLRHLLDASAVWIQRAAVPDRRVMASGRPAFGQERRSNVDQPPMLFTRERDECFELAADEDRNCRIMARLGRSRDSLACIRQAALLRPVLESWLSLRKAREVERSERDTLWAVLDDQSLATIIAASDGTIRMANRSARELLDLGDQLYRHFDMLAVRTPADTIRLRVAIAHVLDGSNQSSLLRLPATAARRSIMLAVCSIDGANGLVAVHILDPNIDVEPMLEPLCKAYELTPVECRLAKLLATGCTLAVAAQAMHVKEATARGYLKQIFLKTDTHRQSDLIRVLLSAVIRSPSLRGAQVL